MLLLISMSLASQARAEAPLRLTLRGSFGETISLGPPEQARTTIVFIMSPKAQEESNAFGREVDERTLDADIDSVAIVDLHRYGGWLRGLASSRLRKAAEETLARRRARRQGRGADGANGATNNDEIVRRWHLVGDFDGSLLMRFAVAADPGHPLAFVLDRRGALQGPFRQVADVITAVAHLRSSVQGRALPATHSR
jgi:hypothetical protein